MAEFVMKALVKEAGKENDFLIESAATSTEEIGNDIHYGTRQILIQNNIPFSKRRARQITKDDYVFLRLFTCNGRREHLLYEKKME